MIDLRSDTVTRPCKNMRLHMYKAEVGDNFYREDKITQELEEYCAQYFGKEAALFTVSGTMSNQIALRTYIQPGNEIILDASYHINYYEHSATSLLGGSLNLVQTVNGIIKEKDLLCALKNRYRSSLTGLPKLLCLENTINFHSGKVFPLDSFQKICSLAKKNNLGVYLDGARLLNACSAINVSVLEFTKNVDSLMISFAKGLGAPMGSILMGNADFINEARKYQKWYGGGLHQSGIMASAAYFSIRNNVTKLAEDHLNAKLLASMLSKDKRIKLNFEIDTNIVMFSFRDPLINIEKFIKISKNQGLLLYPWNHSTIRAVTHKDIKKDQIKLAAEKILQVLCYLSSS